MPDSVGRFLRSTELTVIGNDATSFTVEPPLEIDPRDYVVAVRFWLSDPHRTTPWVVDPESVAVSADDVTVTLSTAFLRDTIPGARRYAVVLIEPVGGDETTILYGPVVRR